MARRKARTTRATLAGVLIAIGSLYLLSVSYNIPRSTLLGWLFGSVLLIVAMMIAAVGLVVIYRLLARLLSRQRERPPQDADDDHPG
jgi:uncharacterized membrane protein